MTKYISGIGWNGVVYTEDTRFEDIEFVLRSGLDTALSAPRKPAAHGLTDTASAERFLADMQAYDAALVKYNAEKEVRSEIAESLKQLWRQKLRNEYSYFSDEVFAAIYAKAQDNTRVLTEMREEFEELADFAHAIVNAQRAADKKTQGFSN